MVLQVPFDRFAETVERRLGVREAYVSSQGSRTVVSAAVPEKGHAVVSVVFDSEEKVRASLGKAGLEIHSGTWRGADVALDDEGADDVFVAAVAYRSGEAKPGLWVDASWSPLTSAQALRALYDELSESGELVDVSYEEFVRVAEPNVVVLEPDEIQGFARDKQGC
jgi:hypothetical protein